MLLARLSFVRMPKRWLFNLFFLVLMLPCTRAIASDAIDLEFSPNRQLSVAGDVTATVSYGSSGIRIMPNLRGGDASSLEIAAPPAHGRARVSGQVLVYTPDAGYSGGDGFSYRATNAAGTSAPATVTLSVEREPLVIEDVSIGVAADSAGNSVPLGFGAGEARSVAIQAQPQHGIAVVSGSGIRYTPVPGFAGDDSFTYSVVNASGHPETATVSVNVSARPDPGRDQDVAGMISGQTAIALRFMKSQLASLQQHLEGLHAGHRPDPDAAGKALARRPATPALAVASRATYGGAYPFSSAEGRSDQPSRRIDLVGGKENLFGAEKDLWSAGSFYFGRDGYGTRFMDSSLSFGADHRFNSTLTMGVGGGFGHVRQRIGEHGSRILADHYAVSLYGSYRPVAGMFIDGLLGYGYLVYDSWRRASGVDRLETMHRVGSQWFSSMITGYEYRRSGYLLSPYVRGVRISSRVNAGAESGAGSGGLSYAQQDAPSTMLAIGFRGQTLLSLGSVVANPYFRVEYQHEFDAPGEGAVAYADDRSGMSRLAVDGFDRDAMVLGVGSSFSLSEDWDLGIHYQFRRAGPSSQTEMLDARVRKGF